jgi:pyridoxine 5-phosphate synthase
VRELRREFSGHWGEALEFNIEGDPTPEWLDLVCEAQPAQATLVPVTPGEVTSQAGWQPERARNVLEPAIARLRGEGIRVSLFVDAEPDPIRWARELGADRVELYTEPYARAFERGPEPAARSFEVYAKTAELAHQLGLGINAGHDLDRENLPLFAALPHLSEVSIGHALMSDALFMGLEAAVKTYRAALRG